MLLRDFLYVDSDKVRGLLAQLDEGVAEGATESEHSEKLTGGGFKGIAEHSQRWGGDRTVQKSLGDALFPTLEQALESLGMLHDISEDLMSPDYWGASMRESLPPGALIRVTAPGALFDARYVASTFAAFATSYQGLVNMGSIPAAPAPPLKKGGQGGQLPKARRPPAETEPKQLEDEIPDVAIEFGDESVSRELLRGMVQLSRGMFTPGLHLNMSPAGVDSHVVTARLQEGRQFLDGESDVLFARYGAGVQSWTLVGSIGHYGTTSNEVGDGAKLVDDDERINRSAFVSFVNSFMSYVGTLGFVDAPAEPGFSVVPLAVYRAIGEPEEPALHT